MIEHLGILSTVAEALLVKSIYRIVKKPDICNVVELQVVGLMHVEFSTSRFAGESLSVLVASGPLQSNLL